MEDRAVIYVELYRTGKTLVTGEKRVGELISFNQYQKEAHKTSSPNIDQMYHSHAICGEAGEVAELFKKFYYHGVREFGKLKDKCFLEALDEELGDLLWGIAECATYYGLDLNRIAERNIEKLQKRYPGGFASGGGVR